MGLFNLFSRLKTSLKKTHQILALPFKKLLLSGKQVNEDLFEELEDILLSADLGVQVTDSVMSHIRAQKFKGDQGEAVYQAIQTHLTEIALKVEKPLLLDVNSENSETKKPFVILMVGINGAGKTTTIGKLAHLYRSQGLSVMLAAGDTFRAAAVEQLQAWGERSGIPVVAQHTGADSASVIYDAVLSAKAKGIDVVLADTAGRLHNKSNLMAELQKVVKVIKKTDSSAPHEVLLVLDATIGQNGLVQAEAFQKAVEVSGVIMTKLDGTAKGGIIFSLAERLGIPVRYIAVGEQKEDLKPYVAKDYVAALFEEEEID